jgi:site-specific DNA recombinase
MQVSDGESLERQEEQIRSFCARKGIRDLEIIADKGMSGFKSNRPGFQRLIQLCASKQVKMVIVYDLSRLSRSVRDTLAFIEDDIQKNGIEFASIQQDLDTSTPMGKAFLGFTAIFNQLYRDEIAHKTKAALKHKRSKGEKTGGVVPFGFNLVGESRLTPAPGETDTIRYIHQLRRKGLSLREIVVELHSKGIKTKTGLSKWNPKVVKSILERQITEITSDPTIPDQEKDHLLEDVAGALYDAQDLSKAKRRKAALRTVEEVG